MTNKRWGQCLLFLLVTSGIWLIIRHGTRIPETVISETLGDVPAYHAIAANGALPNVLSSRWFHDPFIRDAYVFAAKDKTLLYQLPCYCFCDRHRGHKSLLDCFVDDHGAMCSICLREVIYAHHAQAQGMTAPQIRSAIVRGEWQAIEITP